jgi:VanZ family protein
MKRYQRLLHTLPALVWMAVILSFTFQTGTDSAQLSGRLFEFINQILMTLNIHVDPNTLHLLLRKAAHFVEYLILGWLVLFALKPYAMSIKQRMMVVLSVGFVFASIDELIQTMIPGRVGSVIDVLIDTAGVFMGLCLYVLWIKIRKKHVI